MRLPRTTGALSGLLIILLALWGGLIPFVGPYFHFAFGGYAKWHYTSERLWLSILPAIAALVGGFLIFTAARRPSGILGSWLALAGGVWFIVGPAVSLLWHRHGYPIGVPAGGHIRQMFEWLGYFFGIGAAITALSAFAMGRFVSRPHLVVDEPVAAGAAVGRGDVGPARGDVGPGRGDVGPGRAASAGGAGAGAEAGAGATAGGDDTMAADNPGAERRTVRRRRGGLFGRRRDPVD